MRGEGRDVPGNGARAPRKSAGGPGRFSERVDRLVTRVVPERWLATAFAATAAGALLFFILMSVGLATWAVGESDAVDQSVKEKTRATVASLRAELDEAVKARDMTKLELEKAESARRRAAGRAEAAERGARETEARRRHAEDEGRELASCAADLEKYLASERARADELERRLGAPARELENESARAAAEDAELPPEALLSTWSSTKGRPGLARLNGREHERRFGVRAGYVDFGWGGRSGDGGIESTALVGMYFASPRSSRSSVARNGKVGYELGLDYARPVAEDGSYESSLLTGRLDFLHRVIGNGESAARAYLLWGLAGSADLVDEGARQYTNYAGALNLGTGIDVGDGRLDVRFTYSHHFGSENASGAALVSAAVSF